MMRKELARYVELKRSLGFQFRCQHLLLKGFVAFAAERGDRYVKTARVFEWAALAPSPAQRRRRLLTVRRFALAMHVENARHQIPASDALGKAAFTRATPYIYKASEIARLIQAASALEPAGTMRPVMYATLIGLIASTGMRISEALALRVDDITADGLLVSETKFQKSRLLPLHATTQRALDRYIAVRNELSVVDRALFLSVTGKPLPYSTVRNVFQQLLKRTALKGAHAGHDPRIHDLRHTFAVRSLEQCRHDTEEVARHIVALSTYLGHTHVTDTYWYLQATPVLMGQIAKANEALLLGGAA
jgi:integrase